MPLTAAPLTCGSRRGGALCTLSAFDIAQQVASIFASSEPKDEKWQTQKAPTVTVFAWASPRVGNYSFLKARAACPHACMHACCDRLKGHALLPCLMLRALKPGRCGQCQRVQPAAYLITFAHF